MSLLQTYRFDDEPSFRRSGTAPEWDAATAEQVSRIWQAATADAPGLLTDNDIVAIARRGDTFELAPVPYRYFFAQTVRPGLLDLPVTALAVSGFLLCENRLIMGRRSETLLQDPGALEFAPSGSVDADCLRTDGTVDLLTQFDRELHEEVGIPADWARGHRLLGAIEDDEAHVMDVIVRADLTSSFAEVAQAHAKLDCPEYTELLAFTQEAVQQMIDNGGERISAVSISAFKHFGTNSSATGGRAREF